MDMFGKPTNYDRNRLEALLNLNPLHGESERELLLFYQWMRAHWSRAAWEDLRAEFDLNLRSRNNRVAFARLGIERELVHCDGSSGPFGAPALPRQLELIPTAPVQENVALMQAAIDELQASLQHLQEAVRGLLPEGEPLNGTEKSPAMLVLGSPTTLTELNCSHQHGYQELRAREHPDRSPFPAAEAQKRYAAIELLHRAACDNWESARPTTAIAPQQLQRRLAAKLPFGLQPESFVQRSDTPWHSERAHVCSRCGGRLEREEAICFQGMKSRWIYHPHCLGAEVEQDSTF
ncbi:MAG: hypothetical protein AAFY11_07940 [Cyanobacteria bacterium J06641_5]